MPVVLFSNARMFVGGIDLSGRTNDGSLLLEAREEDISSVRDEWEVWALGRKRAEFNAKGWLEYGDGKTGDLETKVGEPNQVTTVFVDGAVGSVGYSVQALPTKLSVGGPGGEFVPYALTAKGDISRAVRGKVLHADATAVTADGSGTALQLGAVGSNQRVFAAMHTIAVSGTNPTLDVTLRSDNAEGFGSPTTQITFDQQTAIGGQWKSAAGAITDDWWRLTFDIGGTDSPSFLVAVLVAIATVA